MKLVLPGQHLVVERLLTIGIAAGLAVLLMGGTRRMPDPIGGGAGSNGGGPKGRSGVLDSSFAGDGTTWSYISGGGFDVAEAVAVDAAGGIIVGAYGSSWPTAVIRYTAEGTLDTTFGVNGLAAVAAGRVSSMKIQADGRIVVAGSGFFLARLMADGSRDTSFGSGGAVTPLLPGIAYAMALQEDGRIVLAGYTEHGPGSGGFIALARYNTDGSFDASFGSGGVVLTDIQNQARAVAVQPDGRILVAGFSFQTVRFNADGTIDTTFGSEGQISVPFGAYGWDSLAEDIVVQPDGKIVVAGGQWTIYDFAIARLNPDGSLDGTFGKDGMVTTDFNGGLDQIQAIVLQPDGRLVAAGSGGPAHRLPDARHFALARYEPNGALDRNFGKAGKVVVPIDDPIYEDLGRALALQPDGKLVAAGYVHFFCTDATCESSGYALARFLP